MKKQVITHEIEVLGEINLLKAKKSTVVANPNMLTLNQLTAIENVKDLDVLIEWINNNLIPSFNGSIAALESTRITIKNKLEADRASGQQAT